MDLVFIGLVLALGLTGVLLVIAWARAASERDDLREQIDKLNEEKLSHRDSWWNSTMKEVVVDDHYHYRIISMIQPTGPWHLITEERELVRLTDDFMARMETFRALSEGKTSEERRLLFANFTRPLDPKPTWFNDMRGVGPI